MSNITLMKQFVDTHGKEIAALIADLGLQDVDIRFDGRRPKGLREDPTLMWEYHQYESGNDIELGFCIHFCWDNIINHESELRYGLIVLAQCLHAVVQQVKDILSHQYLECDCDVCIERGLQARLQKAESYAYKAVQRLFTLFSSDEIKALMDYGCFCKRCRKEAMRGLRRSGRPLIA
jgi:hypothetical protein